MLLDLFIYLLNIYKILGIIHCLKFSFYANVDTYYENNNYHTIKLNAKNFKIY